MSIEIDAIVEVPKDSKVKYEFCYETNKVRVDRILPSAYNYPFNYGYSEKTLAEDGDALDIIIINEQPIYPMSVIKVRPIGVMMMIDGDVPDPKIIACPATSVDKRYKYMTDITDLPEIDKLILKDFFSNYKNNEQKVTSVTGFLDRNEASDIINRSVQKYQDKQDQNNFNCEEDDDDNEKSYRRSSFKEKDLNDKKHKKKLR